MKKLSELWQSYADHVIPPTASPIQRQETRRAFYAGATALFNGVTAGLTEGPEPREEDVRALEALSEELEAFARDIQAGKA
jgi:hypothetical protein